VNWLDIILAIFLILSAFIGLERGLVRTIVPLVGLIVGVLVAGSYYDALAHRLLHSNSAIAYIFAFAIIVVAFLVMATIFAVALQKVLSLTILGWLDRLGGMVLGLATGSIIAGALLALLLKHPFGVSAIEDSAVASFLVDKSPLVSSLLPGDFDRVRDFFH
jgi:membrane protein required for colicin V production